MTSQQKVVKVPLKPPSDNGSCVVKQNILQKPSIFIGYSHKDKHYKDYVVSHLKVAEKQDILETWNDRLCAGGGNWRADIDAALAKAKIAILLVSHHSLTSDFILDEEVSVMLQRREADGLLIYPIVVRACDWAAVAWLKAMNLKPVDGKALALFQPAKRDEIMADISQEIRIILGSLRDKA